MGIKKDAGRVAVGVSYAALLALRVAGEVRPDEPTVRDGQLYFVLAVCPQVEPQTNTSGQNTFDRIGDTCE